MAGPTTASRGLVPVETRYRGYRFRSRLEARWAVFFDALGVRYQFEAQGFDLGGAGWYLPDFYLPDHRLFVEAKRAGFDLQGDRARRLMAFDEAVRETRQRFVVLVGEPYVDAYVVARGIGCGVETWWGVIGEYVRDEHFRRREQIPHAPRLMHAYRAARSARFDRHEQPARPLCDCGSQRHARAEKLGGTA